MHLSLIVYYLSDCIKVSALYIEQVGYRIPFEIHPPSCASTLLPFTKALKEPSKLPLALLPKLPRKKTAPAVLEEKTKADTCTVNTRAAAAANLAEDISY